MIQQQRVSDQKIPAFLAQVGTALTNPYIGESASLDSQRRNIYFLCLREKEQEELTGHRIDVLF